MLAYVFWHYPKKDVDRVTYESSLNVFHAALANSGMHGLKFSTTFRIADLPWINESRPAYEDWYILKEWSAFEDLNALAVSGERRSPHDSAARAMGTGAGGIYALRNQRDGAPAAQCAQWIIKPRGMPYETLDNLLNPLMQNGSTLWRRMMVLGPGYEFCLTGPSPAKVPEPLQALEITRRELPQRTTV